MYGQLCAEIPVLYQTVTKCEVNSANKLRGMIYTLNTFMNYNISNLHTNIVNNKMFFGLKN